MLLNESRGSFASPPSVTLNLIQGLFHTQDYARTSRDPDWGVKLNESRGSFASLPSVTLNLIQGLFHSQDYARTSRDPDWGNVAQ